MALERQQLRDDLVAVIGAARDLSPENDYALADVFIRLAREQIVREVAPPRPLINWGQITTLIGAAVLALTTLASPFLLFHGGHDRDGFDRTAVPQPVQPGSSFGPPNSWHNGDPQQFGP
jgi:hypothetical protein